MGGPVVIAFLVCLASVVLLGTALALRSGSAGRAPRAGPPEPLRAEAGEDLLPESGSGDGLATFYAYQMAVRKSGAA